MARIVEFMSAELRSAVARGSQATETGAAPGAEIIIFPGVRRERHAEPPSPAAGPDQPMRPMRDIIELPD